MKQLGDVTENEEKDKIGPKTFNNVRRERQYGWKIGRAGQQTWPGQADTPILPNGMFLSLLCIPGMLAPHCLSKVEKWF